MEPTVFSWANALSGVSFTDVFSGITSIIPIIIGPIIGFIGFRKGWAFLKSQIKGA